MRAVVVALSYSSLPRPSLRRAAIITTHTQRQVQFLPTFRETLERSTTALYLKYFKDAPIAPRFLLAPLVRACVRVCVCV